MYLERALVVVGVFTLAACDDPIHYCDGEPGWCVVELDPELFPGNETHVGFNAQVFGAGERIWVIGTEGSLYFDGTTWHPEVESNVPIGQTWVAALDDLWMVESDAGTLWRTQDGRTWAEVDLVAATGLAGLRADRVFGSGPADVWVLVWTDDPDETIQHLVHWDGVAWTHHAPPTIGPYGAASTGCSTSPTDVLVTAGSPFDSGHAVVRWDGQSWAVDRDGGGDSMFALHCPRDDVWLQQDGGEDIGRYTDVFRLDAGIWTEIDIEGNPCCTDIFASSIPGEGWLLGQSPGANNRPGDAPQVWHVAGAQASVSLSGDLGVPMRSTGTNPLQKLWETDAGRVFVFTGWHRSNGETESGPILEYVRP